MNDSSKLNVAEVICWPPSFSLSLHSSPKNFYFQLNFSTSKAIIDITWTFWNTTKTHFWNRKMTNSHNNAQCPSKKWNHAKSFFFLPFPSNSNKTCKQIVFVVSKEATCLADSYPNEKIKFFFFVLKANSSKCIKPFSHP